jgi:hypothetical protein
MERHRWEALHLAAWILAEGLISALFRCDFVVAIRVTRVVKTAPAVLFISASTFNRINQV